MPPAFKACRHLVTICLLWTLPMALRAGGTPEDVKAFQENKAKAEAAVGFGGYPGQSQAGQEVGAPGRPPADVKITPGAFVANAYLSGIGVDRDEETALLWYFRVKGQKGLNEEGFKALIRAMPGQQLYKVNQRRSEEVRNYYKKLEEAPRAVDQVFRPVDELKSSTSVSSHTFAMAGSSSFVSQASWERSKRLLLEEFIRSKGSDELLYSVVSCMEHFEFKPFSARIAFTRDVADADKALFEKASELIKARISALIADPSGADSSLLGLVASAYEKGVFGLKADPEQHKRWAELARAATISEAKVRVAAAESSGPEVWLLLANEMKWASPEVRRILASDHGWTSRYVEILTIKAEAGDLASIDGLVSFYGASVMSLNGFPRPNGIHERGYERDQLFRWISERHKLSKNPDDAIILAHHYLENNQADLSMRLVNGYLNELVRKAKKGSLRDLFKVALLADPEWYEKLGGHVRGHVAGDIGQLLSVANTGEFFSFREHGRLLKQLGKVGGNISSMMQEGYTLEQFNDPNFVSPEPVRLVPRSLYLRYVEEFKKQEGSAGGLIVEREDLDCFIAALGYLAGQDEIVADQYTEIKGLSRDHDASLRWRRELAGLGDHWSLMLIAASFERGRGVPRDLASAYAYYAFAGNGPSDGPFPSGLGETYVKTQGTNEQKLDACFKLSPADKERALKIYNELASKLIDRLNRLAAKAGEEMSKNDLQATRDYLAQKSGKAKALKK